MGEGTDFKIRVYVEHGIFEYPVKTMDAAIEHANVITKTRVYRRVNGRGEVEFFPVHKVKVIGEGLGSQYTDTFIRT